MSRSLRRGLLSSITLLICIFALGTAEGQLAPSNLMCEVQSQSVQLSWTNGEIYDFVEIRRNNLLIQTLPGTSTSFLDPGVPQAFHIYTIHGVINAVVGTAGAVCQIQIIPPPLEPPHEPPPSLKTLLPPMPSGIFNYVKNMDAAVRLGKAFFWDMQTGSDGMTACATCHYHAGTDTRSRNILNPGPDGIFQVGNPNQRLSVADFPFIKHQDIQDQTSPTIFNSDDRGGSQGVHQSDFVDIIPGSEEDERIHVADSVFNVGNLNTRRVTTRNAPTVINSVYMIENFWDGRASFWFNGKNFEGVRDPNARVHRVLPDGTVILDSVLIDRASLASQAVAPPLSTSEMSAHGRDFFKLAKKLLSLQPLRLQEVHPNDSVLAGVRDNIDGMGLSVDYAQMIQAAFHDEWWNSTELFDATLTPLGITGEPIGTDQFSMMETNFSFFWGLAIMMYEATLVSDDSPYDQWQDGNPDALTEQELQGADIFTRTNCLLCHTTPVFTSAVSSKLTVVLEPEAGALEGILERMPMKDVQLAVYDGGFYNIGVRPTAEDIGRGATINGEKISFAGYIQEHGLGSLPFDDGSIVLNPPPQPGEEIAMAGAMKTPTLRNLELTGPYFHNGSYGTIEQVVDFYARGGNFAVENVDTLAPEIIALPFLLNSVERREALVAFMESLTDERVRQEMAPFDHPQLFIAEGAVGDATSVEPTFQGSGIALDNIKEIPAVGALGRPAEGLDPLLEFLQPAKVQSLACNHDEVSGVQLSWINADLYPNIKIERDEVLINTLAGGNEAFLDNNQVPGSWDYTVFAIDGTQVGLQSTCTVEIAPDPVAALNLDQLATGVAINWTNQNAYDEISLLRDGAALTTLIGSSTVFLDAGATPGLHTYEVIASVEGVSSAATSAELTVLPAPILSLNCVASAASTATLTWVNGTLYDSIEVSREGAFLTTLAGDAATFEDAAAPSGITEYSLLGRINGTDSAVVTCSLTFVPAGISSFSCSEVAGAGSLSWANDDTFTQIEVARNGQLLQTLAGSATSFSDATLNIAGPGLHDYTLTPSTDGIDGAQGSCTITIVPTAVNQIVCNVIPSGNLVSWTNTDLYDAIEVRADGALIATLGGHENFFLDTNVTPGTVLYEVTGFNDGISSVGTSCSAIRTPLPVDQLSCLQDPGGIALSWVNHGNYDELQISRNGTVVANVLGSLNTFLDTSPATGVSIYSVRAFNGALGSSTAPTCAISVLPAPITDLNCALVDPCSSEVNATWTNGELYDSIQVSVNGVATSSISGFLSQLTLPLAGPGSYTIELTAVKQQIPAESVACQVVVLDNSATAPISLATAVNPDTCTANLTWVNQGTYGSLQLTVSGEAPIVLDPSATTAVINLSGPGSVQACLEATTECGTAIAPICVDVNCSAPFKRGDANADSILDISDAIYTMIAIFLGGPPSTCQDAADTNDDGMVDISDAISGLMAVFGETGLPAPPFADCGTDPTTDGLDCASYAPCQ